MENHNSQSDKFSFYFFVGSLAIALFMCIGYLVKISLEEDNNIQQNVAVETPIIQSEYYTDIQDSVTLSVIEENFGTPTFIGDVQTPEEFKVNSAAVFITTQSVAAFDNDSQISSLEGKINANPVIFYMNASSINGFAKVQKINLLPRPQVIKSTKPQVG